MAHVRGRQCFYASPCYCSAGYTGSLLSKYSVKALPTIVLHLYSVSDGVRRGLTPKSPESLGFVGGRTAKRAAEKGASPATTDRLQRYRTMRPHRARGPSRSECRRCVALHHALLACSPTGATALAPPGQAVPTRGRPGGTIGGTVNRACSLLTSPFH